MYSTMDTETVRQPSGLKRLARRDLPATPRTPPVKPAPAAIAAATTFAWPELTIAAGYRWLLSGLKWIAVLVVVGGALGFSYTYVAKPKFTAYTDMIIDPSNLQVVNDDLYKTPLDQNAQLLDVESKLRVLTSGNVLRRVVDQLNLTADPEFAESDGPFGLSFLGSKDNATGDPALAAVGALEKKVGAWREERSFVVTLMVSTEDPSKSVKIADATVAAFQAELARQEADGASRTATSLMDRLSELQAGVNAAETAVEAFKRTNNLQETNGELVNSQSMTQINKSAVDAQQALIVAQSHYDELTNPKTGKANADAVQSETMTVLRQQYGLLKQQADAAATTFGPLHPTRASADRQLRGIQAQIDAEAARAVQSAKLELAQAKSTVAQLTAQTDAARVTVSSDDQAQVQLNNLERDAKAKSDVYEAFLARAREVTERQQLDTTNIRIISPATPPETRSWPPRGYVTAGMGAFAGGALGIILALGLGWLGDLRRLKKAS